MRHDSDHIFFGSSEKSVGKYLAAVLLMKCQGNCFLGFCTLVAMSGLSSYTPVSRFLERHSGGGMHHICLEVTGILQVKDELIAIGARILGDGKPKIGANGNPVIFMHPGNFNGTLIELEEVQVS